MKILVIYTSKHGTTSQIADYINKTFQGDLHDISKGNPSNLDDYDLILIGGPIYMGTVNTKLKSFLDTYQETILSKQYALFLVCLKEEDIAADQFNHAYDSKLLEHSLSDGFFTGQLQEDLSLFERFVTFISFDKYSLSKKIDLTQVDYFINEVKEHLSL